MTVDVPRLYLSNETYPELRDVQPRWVKTVTWWRAIWHATRDRRFWVFVSVQLGVLVMPFVAIRVIDEMRLLRDVTELWVNWLLFVGWFFVFAYLQVSWGGDLMRPHLRAVSDKARYACPLCGHSLVGHLDRDDDPIRCPECASLVARDLFEPPYRVPREFLAFPPWRRRPR